MSSDLSLQLLNIANKSDQISKYAAIILHRNKIVGYGHNHLITNTSLAPCCLLRG